MTWAAAAVQAALTPMWPQVVPEAARDVLTALGEQRNGEWRYLEFLQVTSLITADMYL